MSYDEHLISMAGGDGDEIAGIEARIPQILESEMSRAERDRATLLAMVREQRAVIERVREVANEAEQRDGRFRNILHAFELRAALEPTK